MKKQNVYLWCSGPTDRTGSLLAEKLKINWGTKKPNLKNTFLVIGWGTKTKQEIDLEKVSIINHPNKIRKNRNKLYALQTMKKANIPVPNFASADIILNQLEKDVDKMVKLPVVGRTSFHQGGQGMWVCPTIGQVRSAIDEGAVYFQNMIDIDKEYRVHVVGNEVIYIARKVQRSKKEMEEAFVCKEFERQKVLARKNHDQFDEKQVKKVLERQASKMVVDHLVRSNTRGWRFSHVTKYDKRLADISILAVKALGLEFGAIDCCIDANNNIWIIEVNTGPGLEGSSLEAYVNKFDRIIDDILKPKSDDILKPKSPNKTIETIFSAKDRKSAKPTALRAEMINKAVIMSEMIEKANNAQLATLKNVFSKMFD